MFPSSVAYLLLLIFYSLFILSLSSLFLSYLQEQFLFLWNLSLLCINFVRVVKLSQLLRFIAYSFSPILICQKSQQKICFKNQQSHRKNWVSAIFARLIKINKTPNTLQHWPEVIQKAYNSITLADTENYCLQYCNMHLKSPPVSNNF